MLFYGSDGLHSLLVSSAKDCTTFRNPVPIHYCTELINTETGHLCILCLFNSALSLDQIDLRLYPLFIFGWQKHLNKISEAKGQNHVWLLSGFYLLVSLPLTKPVEKDCLLECRTWVLIFILLYI